MWQQRSAEVDPIVWDYHVVVVVEASTDEGTIGCAVLDHDCRTGSVLTAGEWLAASFPVEVPAAYEPRFRLVDAAVFLDRFASDRSHMIDDQGTPLQPFPSWSPIIARDGTHNTLPALLDLDDDDFGTVVDIDGFAERFGLLEGSP